MKVEKVGENSSDGAINKKKWAILFSVFGVVIVGLVVAIVVVLAVRGDGGESGAGSVTGYPPYEEGLSIYFDDNEEIARAVFEENMDGDAMLKAIKDKIDTAENEIARAMLRGDYYTMMLAVYGADENRRDEILNGLIEVDKILGTDVSAGQVADAAAFYQDFDMVEKYSKLMSERNPEADTPYDIITRTEEPE